MGRIAEVRTELLRLPLPRPMMSGSSSGAKGGPVTHINMPIVFITTDDGVRGLGYAWSLLGGAGATRSILQEDFAPLLIGEDALDHERLWQRLYRRLQSVGRHGLVMQAQAAVDLALWDIKGKTANLPVYKLLGGARERTPVYGSDGGWLYMSVPQMLTEFEAYLEQGMAGVKMKIGHDDPQIDVARVREVRKGLGDNVWIAVDANQRWDYPTALRVGRELEQLNVAWFEEPLLCEDIAGHARLASDLDIPIALGETLGSRFEFDAYLRADAVDIVQPDVIRAGGITETVKITTLADAAQRPVELHHMMEVSIQIACGVLQSGKIEFMPWIAAAFAEPALIEDGYMRPPPKPGLGLDVSEEVLTRYRVE
jgi:L-talarate/galactarate dehydratase